MTGPESALNDCGCCEGVASETPREVMNPPGQNSLHYRIATHAQFKASLIAGLPRGSQTGLGGLTTRSDKDFTIALLDAWAMTGDVLTFYQERIANESFRRTATERRSLLELARLIGYTPSTGVAASTDLAFTLDDFPGQPAVRTPLDAGLKVQSVPAPGEEAQIFETIETIDARSDWNAIKPRLTQPQVLDTGMTSLRIRGSGLNVGKGDTIALLIGSSIPTKQVLAVHVDSDSDTTTLDFDPSPTLPQFARPTGGIGVIEQGFPDKVPLDDAALTTIVGGRWKATDLIALAGIQEWSLVELETGLNRAAAAAQAVPNGRALVFRQRAAVFGHNAPAYTSLPANLRNQTSIDTYDDNGTFVKRIAVPAAYPTSWEGRTLEADAEAANNERSLYLDNAYPAIVKGSYVVLRSTGVADLVLEVTENTEVTRSAFTLNAKVSRIRVKRVDAFPAGFTMRSTSVLVQSEDLVPVPIPVPNLVSGDAVTLNAAFPGIAPGRKVVISGERADLPGTLTSEIRTLDDVVVEHGYAVLEYDRPLDHAYLREMVVDSRPATLTINANVAEATHGETRQEVLGSGDGSQAFQMFTLRQPPLTYVSASSPTGSASTLRIYVNDILWHEVPALYGHGSGERIYSTRTDDDGVTTVQFGDGRTGSRLPTGQDNIRAIYRRGTGAGGLVTANQISMPMTRPLGLKGATNPLAPTGGQDPESLEEARGNLPLRVMTLDRIVSLRDYEDFARAFSGIAKALAVETWDGQQRGVLLTVAGANGAAVLPDSKLYLNLRDALRDSGDATMPSLPVSYRPALFRLDATLTYDPDHVPAVVLAAVEAALREAFSFERRTFGQAVTLSEVMSVIHAVEGVVAVDLNELYRTDKAPDRHPMTRLVAEVPRDATSPTTAGAELLTLDPAPIDMR